MSIEILCRWGGTHPDIEPTSYWTQHTWPNYRTAAVEALESISNHDIGRRLLREIVETGHRIQIYSGGPNYGNSATPTEQRTDEYSNVTTPDELEAVVTYATANFSNDDKAKVAQFITSCSAVSPWRGSGMVPRQLGQRVAGERRNADVHRFAPWEADPPWAAQPFVFNDANQQRFKYVFEAHLEHKRGRGCPVNVCWNHNRGIDANYKLEEQDRRWLLAGRLPWIGLAHELVHAWRAVTGRGIFPGNSKEDEHMTVGLKVGVSQPTIDDWLLMRLRTLRVPSRLMTENQFRQEAHQPRRTFY